MKQIELTSKLVLALIAIVVFSAITVPAVVAQPGPSRDGGGIQLNVHIVKEGPRVIPGQSGNSVNVDCPSGEILTGGGYLANGENVISSKNYPLDENTWHVAAYNPNVLDSSFTAYALCIDPNLP